MFLRSCSELIDTFRPFPRRQMMRPSEVQAALTLRRHFALFRRSMRRFRLSPPSSPSVGVWPYILASPIRRKFHNDGLRPDSLFMSEGVRSTQTMSAIDAVGADRYAQLKAPLHDTIRPHGACRLPCTWVNRNVWHVARMSRTPENRVKRIYSSFYFRADSAARAVRLPNQSAADT